MLTDHKKIRIHYHSDCPFFAGCENMLVELIHNLGDDFHLTFSYRHSRAYVEGLESRLNADIAIYPMHFHDPSVLFKKTGSLWKNVITGLVRLLVTLPIFLSQICALYMVFQQTKPDIVHINNGGYPGALSCRAAAIAARMAGVRNVVMVVNNLAIGYVTIPRKFSYALDFFVKNYVTKFVTGSKHAGNRLKETLSLSSSKVAAIPNSVAMRKLIYCRDSVRERLNLPKNYIVFGVVALLIERKGHRYLLEAISQIVQDKNVDLEHMHLCIEGSGELKDELERYAVELGVQHKVSFVGQEEHVFDFINAIDLLILPSIRDEDFPNVILEAMALCKPVIATRLAGVPEQIVPEQTGLIVEPKDTSGLARAMTHFLDNPQDIKKFGRNGRRVYEEKFTSLSSTKAYSKLYVQIMGRYSS